MQKINLLYVITKLELGGAQKQLLSLIERIDQKKYNIFLITAYQGLLVHDASSIKGLSLRRSRFLERSLNPLKDFLALIEIYRFIIKNKINIVHTHSSKAGILGRWAGKIANVSVTIHTIHGWPFHQWQNPIARQLCIFLERLTAIITNKLIAVCEYDIKKGIKFKIGKREKYVLIRYGIDKGAFTDYNNVLGKRKELAIESAQAVVGMVACLKPQKSPQDYIKVASLVTKVFPQVKFLLIGDGQLRPKIEKLIQKFNLKDSVILTGWRKDIPQVLSAIDIFMLTSLWEGLPIVALEALAASKPVIATDTGGIQEIVKDGKTGFLVPPKNINMLAERLMILLKDRTLRFKMAEEARNSLGSEFTYGYMVNKTEELYESLAGEKKYDN